MDEHGDHTDIGHEGLTADLQQLRRQASRRGFLRLLAGLAALPVLVSCRESDGTSGAEDGGAGARDDASAGSCEAIPEETAGPYPGDGSNGVNALALSGIVRSDIRSSLGGASATAEGVPLTIRLTLIDQSDGCRAVAGYAVYLWHCDREGRYSMYSQGVTELSYLRGVQETDDSGSVTFTTVFPGCYDGRMPHVHFEVYPALAAATDAGNKLATSQLAFPVSDCEAVYAQAGYEASVQNLSRTSFASDNVFRDGVAQQLASVTGSVDQGYTATLRVAIAG